MSQSVAVLQDADGVVHYMSSTCQRAVDGLADGSLTPVEEVRDVAADDNAGDGDDAGAADRRPGDRKRNTGARDKQGDHGVAESELGR